MIDDSNDYETEIWDLEEMIAELIIISDSLKTQLKNVKANEAHLIGILKQAVGSKFDVSQKRDEQDWAAWITEQWMAGESWKQEAKDAIKEFEARTPIKTS